MGNSPPTGGLLLGNGDHTYQAKVRGSPATLTFIGREIEEDRYKEIITESWKMTYKVGMSTCVFTLSKISGIPPNRDDDELEIKISDDVHISKPFEFFKVIVYRNEASFLGRIYKSNTHFCIKEDLFSRTTNANGDITETLCDIYGRSRRRTGLVVREWKKKTTDGRPYMGAVTHYYINDEDGEDVGLSVSVKRIRVSCKGQLDFAVDGPQQHPVEALVYMFRQVIKTGTWKPTYCPHCANKYIDERISETETDIDDCPASSSSSQGNKRNGGGLVLNDGKFKGNNNANTFINKLISGRKR